jgi:hypothetical protein
VHHVLSIEPIYLKPDCEDIKLMVGYYGPYLHSVDFTRASDGDAYMMLH